MADHLAVSRGGLFSTLQDFGRFGWQRFGISASGAMDTVSMRIANALVGNPPGTAVVEMTVLGLAATVEAEACRIAVAGDFALRINDRPAEPWRAHDLVRGDRLDVGAARVGMRGYLAVAGGFAVAPTLGSLSTHSRSGIGGLDGRALQPGDRLPLARAGAASGPPLALPTGLRPAFDGPIRVVLGPQDDRFTAAGIDTFLSADYRVSDKADRMGCQLDGPPIAHAGGFNIVSDGVTNGSIQVPGSGRPVVLLADRQTTGGYPKIATVIGPDLHRLGQRRPGDVVRFERVTAEAAVEAARAHRAAVAAMVAGLAEATDAGGDVPAERLLAENLVSGVVSMLD